jgi:hypothetical protein
VPASDPEVVSVQRHLSSLSEKCHESEETLALQTGASLEVLRKRGLHGSLLELVTALEKVVIYAETQTPSKRGTAACTGLLRALVTTFAEKK